MWEKPLTLRRKRGERRVVGERERERGGEQKQERGIKEKERERER